MCHVSHMLVPSMIFYSYFFIYYFVNIASPPFVFFYLKIEIESRNCECMYMVRMGGGGRGKELISVKIKSILKYGFKLVSVCLQ